MAPFHYIKGICWCPIVSYFLYKFYPSHRSLSWAMQNTLFFFLSRFENVSDFTSELEDNDDQVAYVTNLSYYHLVPFETDILD